MPPPRSPLRAAEVELIAALAAARDLDPPDPAAVTAARLALVDHWRAFVWQLARKWHGGNGGRGDLEDYHAAARLGFWEASGRFDPTRANGFACYAARYALKYLAPHARHEAGGGVHRPTYATGCIPHTQFGQMAGAFEGDDTSAPADQAIPARPEADAPPDRDAVWAAVDRALPDPRDRLVVWLRWRCEFSLEEVGAHLGVSKERVRQVELRALDRLRERRAAFAGF